MPFEIVKAKITDFFFSLYRIFIFGLRFTAMILAEPPTAEATNFFPVQLLTAGSLVRVSEASISLRKEI